MKKYSLGKFIVLTCSFLLTCGVINSQDNNSDILMTLGNTKVTLGEFENVYHKNNTIKTAGDEKSVNDYIDLFVNFKLKVKEAEELGLDTTKKFKEELAGYRKQLAQPYLTDREVNDKLLKETYERLQEVICVSHIFIKCSEIALPKDTLIAYNRIMKIYARIQKGESFEKLASEKGVSDDTTLLSKAGKLGCYTALDLVYPFETAAYNTKVGEVSKPVRTRFGYHIIKVNDRIKSPGEVLVAHIMIKNVPRMSKGDSLNQQKKITEIYEKLKAGEDFSKLAKEFSDDSQTKSNGGEVPWFGMYKTNYPEFEQVAFSLKNKGDFSMPFRTKLGVHIIKLIDKRQLGSFNEVKGDLKQKLNKAARFSVSRNAFIAELKKEYNCKEDKKALEELYKLVDTNLFNGKWNSEKALTLHKVLFNFNDKQFTQSDFAAYIANHQRKSQKMDVKMAVDELYKQFEGESAIAYEDGRLEQKYPEFKALMQEYRDGILLFDLTDKKVWSKAVKDSAGQHKFYEANKDKYTWGERADASIFSCSNKESALKVRKLLKKGANEADILKEVNKDSQLNLNVESKMFNKGENALLDKNWVEGVSNDIISEKDNKIIVIHVKKIIKNAPKLFEEAKGAIISDYQNYLEKEWIAELKKKYSVSIDKKVLAAIK